MIEFKEGRDIFEEPVQAYVVPTNLEGVMGKGVALAARQRYGAEFYMGYRRACLKGEHSLNKVWTYQPGEGSELVVCLATKVEWRKPSRLEYIEYGLRNLSEYLRERAGEVESIALPPLGCGAGGLRNRWLEIRQMLLQLAEPLPQVKFVVLKPQQ